MMLKDKISKEQVQELAGEVASALAPETIRRGWEYYRKGQVYNVVVTPEKVQATVQGKYRYLVNINLQDFSLSRCSCPVGVRCEHVAAAFLYLYAVYGWPGEFINNVDEIAKSKKQRLKTTKAAKKETVPEEKGTFADWEMYYEAQFSKCADPFENLSSYYFSTEQLQCRDFFAKVERACRKWGSPAKHYFLFHAALFAMRQLDMHPRKREYYYNYIGIGNWRDYYTTLLCETAAAFSAEMDKQEDALYFSKTISDLRERLCEDNNSFFDWSWTYRLLWTIFARHRDWVTVEVFKLEEILNRKNLTTEVRCNVATGLAHFAFLAGDDAKACAIMNKDDGFNIYFAAPYLKNLYEAKALERLAEWLRHLTPGIDRTSYLELQALCGYWLQIARDPSCQEEALAALQSLLPESVGFYREALLVSGRYKTWVNFHIFQQSYEEIEPEEVRRVEAADVSLLLPLYHQYVANLIERRNRQSYRSAVPLLRKLRNYYKKLKRTEEWERYMVGLTSRYSRLRALQEELRKGKLA